MKQFKSILIPTEKIITLQDFQDYRLVNIFDELFIIEQDMIGETLIITDIVLIDIEAEIVDNSWVIDSEGDLHYAEKVENQECIINGNCSTYGTFQKGISSTNKSHKISDGKSYGQECPLGVSTDDGLTYVSIPQLSPKSIQLLINYYNEHKCMPESVDVETQIENEVLWHANGLSPEANNVGKPRIVKLNQQGEVDVIIPEVEEKLYTEEEMCSNMQQYLDEYVFSNETYVTPQKWLNSKKK